MLSPTLHARGGRVQSFGQDGGRHLLATEHCLGNRGGWVVATGMCSVATSQGGCGGMAKLIEPAIGEDGG